MTSLSSPWLSELADLYSVEPGGHITELQLKALARQTIQEIVEAPLAAGRMSHPEAVAGGGIQYPEFEDVFITTIEDMGLLGVTVGP